MPKRIYVFLLVLILISFVTDLYSYQGIRTLSANLILNQLISWSFWIISEGTLFCLLLLFYRGFPARRFTPVFNIFLNAFLTLFVTKVVFIAVLLAGDIFRTVDFTVHYITGPVLSFPRRSSGFSRLALLVAAFPFFAFLFGVTRGKYHYTVHRTTLYFDDLPDEFDGFKVVQISDVHAGSFDNPRAVQKGVDLINAQKPDLFVFTGDLVNNRAEEIEPYLTIFNQIKAPYGQFSILGNHDYGDYVTWNNPEDKRKNLEKLKGYHALLGYRLLLDEHISIKKGKGQIVLLGIENWGKGFGERGNLQKALNDIDPKTFKILLSHDPSHWDAVTLGHHRHIHITLAGHTHGMQFGIELWGFKWSPVKYRYSNWAGMTRENGKYLYVNRGFGFLGFSGRVGIWPEVTVIQLKKKS